MILAPLGSDAQVTAKDTSSAALAPGDVLRITVWRNAEFSGDFAIGLDGSITHPLYRELVVVGMPFDAVEDRVRSFLSRFDKNPAFVISPLLRIFVGGEVREPSVYTLPPGTTIAQAVAVAGGATERGRLDRVLVRRQREVFVADLAEAAVDRSPIEIRSGDQILVRRGRSFLRDYLGPTSSVIGALAAVASIAIQAGR
jgi:polysaccharide export outer membrane protein